MPGRSGGGLSLIYIDTRVRTNLRGVSTLNTNVSLGAWWLGREDVQPAASASWEPGVQEHILCEDTNLEMSIGSLWNPRLWAEAQKWEVSHKLMEKSSKS